MASRLADTLRHIERLTIRERFIGVLALAALASLTVAAIGVVYLRISNDRITAIVDVTSKRIQHGLELKAAVVALDRAEKSLVLARTPAETERFKLLLDETVAEVDHRLAALRDVIAEKVELDRLDAIQGSFHEYEKLQRHIIDLVELDNSLKAGAAAAVPTYGELERLLRQANTACKARSSRRAARLQDVSCAAVADEALKLLAKVKKARATRKSKTAGHHRPAV